MAWKMEKAGIPTVPILKVDWYFKNIADELVTGPSKLCPEQPIREGIVIKSYHEDFWTKGRLIFKYLNPDYLLQKGMTEYH